MQKWHAFVQTHDEKCQVDMEKLDLFNGKAAACMCMHAEACVINGI